MIPWEQIWFPFVLTFIAGMSTLIGSAFSCCIRTPKERYMYFALGLSAGVMIYISFVDLLPTAIAHAGFAWANMAFFGGMFLIMLIDFFVPHTYIAEKANVTDKQLMRTGMFVAFGIAIHNFPEGFAVFVSSFADLTVGMGLALAIILHNIPEGMAISMPIFYATRSRSKALWYSFLAGIVEPLAAVLAIVFLMPFLTDFVVQVLLAGVAGIMVFISFDELMPLSFKEGQGHVSMAGVILGMLLMAVGLLLLP